MGQKKLLLILFFIILTIQLYASDAVIKSLTGKVEIQAAGSTVWSTVKPGQTIGKGTLISTGFNSNAVVDLGSSEIFLKPLTRISLDELATSGNTIKTNLNLRLGRIDADVKSTEGLKHDFTLRTPLSTAAVRGTRFTAGVAMLDVKFGRIRYANKIGQTRSVSGGSSSSVSGGGYSAPVSAVETVMQNFTVTTTTSVEAGASIIAIPPPPSAPPTGSVTINWDINDFFIN